MPKVSLKMNTKLTQRDRIASLISGTDPEHISPRYLYLWSSLVRLFYEGFPLTPAQISVLEKQIATALKREAREGALVSTALKQALISFSMRQNQDETIARIPPKRLILNDKISPKQNADLRSIKHLYNRCYKSKI